MEPLIITCAITGAETTRERQPQLPVTPIEQAQSSLDCLNAGCSIIHLHVRDDLGKPTQSSERFKESIQLIRSHAPEVIIQISTGGAIGESIENRARPLELLPEMASLNLGTMNFGDDVFFNHPRDIIALATKMRDLKVMPELEVYEAGMLETAYRYAKQGILREPMHFQFVLGVPGGMSGELENLFLFGSSSREISKELGAIDSSLGCRRSWTLSITAGRSSDSYGRTRPRRLRGQYFL